ncbi:hypothetical protein KC19_4G192500 [Ceratodon purpureus]|uniref:Uncharacterized protein n=1 Tax=Ceratodon purpureus TaxID=3225 RepID=A0A8T0ICN0_CERPU|nr:hypothetical protein KC19_4G192500 [Ceratodon purpureus]
MGAELPFSCSKSRRVFSFAGIFVYQFFTSSTPSIRPRPRTLPITASNTSIP